MARSPRRAEVVPEADLVAKVKEILAAQKADRDFRSVPYDANQNGDTEDDI